MKFFLIILLHILIISSPLKAENERPCDPEIKESVSKANQALSSPLIKDIQKGCPPFSKLLDSQKFCYNPYKYICVKPLVNWGQSQKAIIKEDKLLKANSQKDFLNSNGVYFKELLSDRNVQLNYYKTLLISRCLNIKALKYHKKPNMKATKRYKLIHKAVKWPSQLTNDEVHNLFNKSKCGQAKSEYYEIYKNFLINPAKLSLKDIKKLPLKLEERGFFRQWKKWASKPESFDIRDIDYLPDFYWQNKDKRKETFYLKDKIAIEYYSKQLKNYKDRISKVFTSKDILKTKKILVNILADKIQDKESYNIIKKKINDIVVITDPLFQGKYVEESFDLIKKLEKKYNLPETHLKDLRMVYYLTCGSQGLNESAVKAKVPLDFNPADQKEYIIICPGKFLGNISTDQEKKISVLKTLAHEITHLFDYSSQLKDLYKKFHECEVFLSKMRKGKCDKISSCVQSWMKNFKKVRRKKISKAFKGKFQKCYEDNLPQAGSCTISNRDITKYHSEDIADLGSFFYLEKILEKQPLKNKSKTEKLLYVKTFAKGLCDSIDDGRHSADFRRLTLLRNYPYIRNLFGCPPAIEKDIITDFSSSKKIVNYQGKFCTLQGLQ